MAPLFVTALVLGAVSMVLGTTVNEVSLVGRFIPDPICAPDDPACVRPAPSGTNITIWHGDRTCTILWLYCELDRFLLTVDSPAHLTHHSFCALGLNPDSRENQCCKKYNSGPLNNQPKAQSPHRTKYPILYSSTSGGSNCGTVTQQITGQWGTIGDQYSNKVELIEFLEQTTPRLSPAISLISHTHVSIQCCRDPPVIDPIPCPVEADEVDLVRCTEKQFTFKCTSNKDRETFHCFVELNPGESLQTEDVGFTLDTCTARPVGQPGDEVVLFSNGAADGVIFGSGVCGESPADPVDKRVYSIEGSWFQWGEDNCDLHDVQVDCTVKVVPKASLPPIHNDVDFCRTPPGYSRSDRAGFFQAGKLNIIQ